jgi:hypothetical protein
LDFLGKELSGKKYFFCHPHSFYLPGGRDSYPGIENPCLKQGNPIFDMGNPATTNKKKTGTVNHDGARRLLFINLYKY